MGGHREIDGRGKGECHGTDVLCLVPHSRLISMCEGAAPLSFLLYAYKLQTAFCLPALGAQHKHTRKLKSLPESNLLFSYIKEDPVCLLLSYWLRTLSHNPELSMYVTFFQFCS